MGYIYSSDKFKIKVIRFFTNIGFKIAFKFNDTIIVQNIEDKKELIKRKWAQEEKVYIIDGSGVDLNKFEFTKLNINQFKFLMISRMLDVKGIIEYLKAAEIVKKQYKDVEFLFVGSEDYSYRGVKKTEINYFKKLNIVKFMGYKKDVAPYLKECTVFVLPSYLKEGIPRTNLEALAIGRPIITTNVRGCKETVENGKNGFIVNPKDYNELANVMISMIKNKKELVKMGIESNKYAKSRFDLNIINEKMSRILLQ